MMLFRVAMGAAICLGLAATAVAAERVEVVTASIAKFDAEGSSSQPRGQWGLRLGFPLPSAHVGNDELGVHAIGTLTMMENSVLGIGIDVGYQYWPASREFRDSFNALVRREAWNFLELGGSQWGFSAIQVTPHMKLAAPLGTWAGAWLEFGGGLYHVNPNLRGIYGQDGVYVDTDHSKGEWELGYNARFGMDYVSASGVTPGLDIAFHHLQTQDHFGSDFRGYTAGLHVRFGR